MCFNLVNFAQIDDMPEGAREMNILQKKLDCSFGQRSDPLLGANQYEAVAHLFEHAYRPYVHFWYGVLHVPAVGDMFSKEFVYGDTGEGPQEIEIRFEDGRRGTAEITEIFFGEDHILTAFVGHTPLQCPVAV
jgi:hypothetical protein